MAENTEPGPRADKSIVFAVDNKRDLGMGTYAAVTYGTYLDVTARVGDQDPQTFLIPQSVVADAEPVRRGIPMGGVLDELTDDQLQRVEDHIRNQMGGAHEVEAIDCAARVGWGAKPNVNSFIDAVGTISVHENARDAQDAVYAHYGQAPLAENREEKNSRATMH